MSELDARERDLLGRIRVKPELRTLFFRRVKGLKWFDALSEAGYFDAPCLPRPQQAKQEGYVTIPRWEIADYLVKTAPELGNESGERYAERFIAIMSDATSFAKSNDFSNYHTWWQFAEAVCRIPSRFVPLTFLDSVDYWLDDRFDRGLVSSELGEKWLVSLLDEGTDHSFDLAEKLMGVLYKVVVGDGKAPGRERKALLRVDAHYAMQITDAAATLSGKRLGLRSVEMLRNALEAALAAEGNDAWSSIWQPAIEKHPQNEHRDDPENILTYAFRDCLEGFVSAEPASAREYVAQLFKSPLDTVQRIAIHCVTRYFSVLERYASHVVNAKYLSSNFRHETWHFLKETYGHLSESLRKDVVSLISGLKSHDEDGAVLEVASAYEHAIWFAAIKDFGQEEYDLYRDAAAIAKSEPEHPDFSSYMSAGWVGPESPFTVAELAALPIAELVRTLAGVTEGGRWREPGIEGLAKTLKELVKSSPMRFYGDLGSFKALDLAYVHAVIEAYSELWVNKASLPWDDIWEHLLGLCFLLVETPEFWEERHVAARNAFVANRNWVVSAIARLLEAGAKTDEHAFDQKHHEAVESLLALLLRKQQGAEFREGSDAVSVAINSPRGHCLEALINLTLRTCRLADRSDAKDHSAAWKQFQPHYDEELLRYKNGSHEFSTLATNYLPNFLYMSRDWVLQNLESIFDQNHHLHWLCAMQGYAYVNVVYADIYAYLRAHGDLVRALDDPALTEKVSDKVVQNIVMAYVNGLETLDDQTSLIRLLLERSQQDELSQLIWFVWTLRTDKDNELGPKVSRLWELIQAKLDLSTKNGQQLASRLCHWSVFVQSLDRESIRRLLQIAPYADESHNAGELLRNLARLSNEQPFEANEIWRAMLQGSRSDYPEEAIKQILSNLVARGEDGKRAARDTVSEYLRHAAERPSRWLTEILRSR